MVYDAESYWEKRFTEGEIWGGKPSKSVTIAANIFKENGLKTILVPGCGYGRNSLYLAKRGFTVTAFDISPSAIEIANKKRKKILENRRGRPEHVYCAQPWLTKMLITKDPSWLREMPLSRDGKKLSYLFQLSLMDFGVIKECYLSWLRFAGRFLRAEKALEFYKSLEEFEDLHPSLKGKLWSDKITSQHFKAIANKIEKGLGGLEKFIDLELASERSKLIKLLKSVTS